MEKIKVDQIKDKICDYMLSIDLNKLPMYDLISYINAYNQLSGNYSFSGFGFPSFNSCATSTLSRGTSKGE